jgi:hypothetical protein
MFCEEMQLNLIYRKEWPFDICVDLIGYGINSFQNFVSNGQNAARFLNMCCQLEKKKNNF